MARRGSAVRVARSVVGAVLLLVAATAVGAPAAAEPDGRVTVEIVVAPDVASAATSVAALVGEVGGRVLGDVPGYLVLAELPTDTLATVRAAPAVAAVRPPTRNPGVQPLPPHAPDETALPGNRSRDVTGQHVGVMNAAAWHANGYTGAGLKIGIIDGFDTAAWAAAQAAGDLPAPAGTLCLDAGSECAFGTWPSDHGVSVAEVIHDLVPDAQLYLVEWGTLADFAAVMYWLRDQGVHVINRSEGLWFDYGLAAGTGTGPFAAIANELTTVDGIAFFNAAGNEGGHNGYPGQYARAPYRDADDNSWLEFPMSDGSYSESVPIECYGTFRVYLRWSDWGALADVTDYDLFVTDDNGAEVSTSDDPQGHDGLPHNPAFEATPAGIPCDPNETYWASVRNWDNHPADGDTIELTVSSGWFPDGWSSANSAAIDDITAAEHVFAIGAIEANHVIAPYSSQGPVNNGRMKPDFSARTDITTFTHPDPTQPFNGTSAASPAAAGMAALVLSAGLATTPAELREWLEHHATVDRGAPGPDNVYGFGELQLPAPPGASAPAIEPTAPTRYLDTRGGPTFDGTFTGGGRLAGGSFTRIQVGGRGPVPAGALGAVVNLTAVSPAAPGHATLFPCAATGPVTVPKASHVNYVADNVANNVLIPLGADGTLCVATHAGADFVLDVNGYVPAGSPVQLFTPARYLDTRPSGTEFDGPGGPGPVPAEHMIEVQIAGRGAVPNGATSAIVSVTAVAPNGPGYVSLYPCSGDPRAASTLNYGPGEVVPNGAVVRLSSSGTLCIFTKSAADLLLDVSGYVPAGATGVIAQTPARIVDTRTWDDWVYADHVVEVQVAGAAGAPGHATAALLNVAAVGPWTPGYLTLWPCGPRPVTSNVNFVADANRANNALTKLSPDGTVCIYTKATTDIILDVSGWVG